MCTIADKDVKSRWLMAFFRIPAAKKQCLILLRRARSRFGRIKKSKVAAICYNPVFIALHSTEYKLIYTSVMN